MQITPIKKYQYKSEATLISTMPPKRTKQYIEPESGDDYEAEIEVVKPNPSRKKGLKGGREATAVELNEGDDDTESIDSDPDDDPEGDGTFDPINDVEEPVDSDEEIGDADDDDAGSDADTENEDGAEEVDDDADADVDVDTGADGDDDGNNFDVETAADTKACYLKNLNKDMLVLDEDDSSMYATMEPIIVAPENRESDPIMTYYEMVRVIGVRAKQFDYGAEPLVRGLTNMHSAKMAFVELMAGMTPFILRRRLPGKRLELWRIDELDIIHPITDPFFVPENFDWVGLFKQPGSRSRVALSAMPH